MILPNVSHCIAENEVHYNPFVPDPYNGHAYVDLGLPSGTKWATMNVGATKPEEYGLHFAWGETEGYADASTKAFTWDDYKYGKYNSSDPDRGMTKYNGSDGKTVLDLDDDAAHVNWGGQWKMPTKDQCDELFNTANCTNTWTTVNGVNGRLFTSVSNGNTLFVPAAGVCDGGSVGNVGNGGNVWASSLGSGNVGSAWGFYFNSGGGGVSSNNRFYGLSVRAVVG